jgi:hypothetical protein
VFQFSKGYRSGGTHANDCKAPRSLRNR